MEFGGRIRESTEYGSFLMRVLVCLQELNSDARSRPAVTKRSAPFELLLAAASERDHESVRIQYRLI